MVEDTFWKFARRTIIESDVIIHVLDARLGELTKSKRVVDLCAQHNKPLIFVLAKCDLIGMYAAKRLSVRLDNAVIFAKQARVGASTLRRRIYALGAKDKSTTIMVGVVGYPNVGKSSVINLLKGRHAAKASSRSGTTVGIQHVRVTQRIMLVDTPGVLPLSELPEGVLMLVDAKNIDHVKDPHIAALSLLEVLRQTYGEQWFVREFGGTIDEIIDDDMLERIAIERNRLKKGGLPDTATIARQLLLRWHKGGFGVSM